MTPDEVASRLTSGMTVGIGGWGSRRKPMALVNAILRSDVKNLTVVSYGGPDVGLLAAAGRIRKLVTAFVTLDSIPLEPHFRAARQAGTLELVELDEAMIMWGLTAAVHRLPFMPIRAGLGSDVMRVNPHLRTVTSPYEDAEDLVAVPALHLDAALVHLNRADPQGNGQYLGPDPYFDDLFCEAADTAYVSCERIVDTADLLKAAAPQSLLVKRQFVTGVIEAPGGAHFTSCAPDYDRDEAAQLAYTQDVTPFLSGAPSASEPKWSGRCRKGERAQAARNERASTIDFPQRFRWEVPPQGLSATEANRAAEKRGDRATYCVIACAEAWRGDGEILASPMGAVPSIGARLARLTFAPDLLLTDGEALLVDADGAVEGWLPYRRHLALVTGGRRHVMMGASQIDRHGNQNISCVGEWARPTRQLLGVRGAPVNTLNNPTSYWIPKHSPRVFVEQVDMVCGVGYARAAEAGPSATRFHEIRRVVSNLGVFDFETPDHTMRVRSLHPGVTLDEVREATGFELATPEGPQGPQGPRGPVVPYTREPTPAELQLIREVLDPVGLRYREVIS
jgi:glutaconate CoA-transferase subunit A